MEIDVNAKKKKKKSRKEDDLADGNYMHDFGNQITESSLNEFIPDVVKKHKKKKKKQERQREEDNSEKNEFSPDITSSGSKKKKHELEDVLTVQSKKHKKRDVPKESCVIEEFHQKSVSFSDGERENVLEMQHRKTKKRKHAEVGEDIEDATETVSQEERAKKKHKKKKKHRESEEVEADPPESSNAMKDLDEVADSDDQSLFITQTPSRLPVFTNRVQDVEEPELVTEKMPKKKKNKKSEEAQSSSQELSTQEELSGKSSRQRKNSVSSDSSEIFLIDKLMDMVDGMEMPSGISLLDFEPPLLHQKGSVSVLTKTEKEELKAQGVKIRTSSWTKGEDAILQRNMLQFIEKEGIPHPALLLGFVPSLRNRLRKYLTDTNFYILLAKNLDDRPLHSVYKRARRIFSPYPKLDSMTSDEVCEILSMQARKGNKWAEFAKILNRPPDSLESTLRWRTTKTNSGEWTLDEDDLLLNAVKKYSKRIGQNINGDTSNLPWEKIAKKVKTRNPSQCHQRWIFTLCFEAKIDNATKWKKKYDACLIYLLQQSDFNREEDIDWQEISDKIDKKCNVSLIKRKWRLLKYNVPNYKTKDFDDCVLYLYHNYLPNLLKSIRWNMDGLKKACES